MESLGAQFTNVLIVPSQPIHDLIAPKLQIVFQRVGRVTNGVRDQTVDGIDSEVVWEPGVLDKGQPDRLGDYSEVRVPDSLRKKRAILLR